MITTQQLMRVYGAMMWSLGKVVKTPEGTLSFYHNYFFLKIF
jgi:EH domain-containing protein 1